MEDNFHDVLLRAVYREVDRAEQAGDVPSKATQRRFADAIGIHTATLIANFSVFPSPNRLNRPCWHKCLRRPHRPAQLLLIKIHPQLCRSAAPKN